MVKHCVYYQSLVNIFKPIYYIFLPLYIFYYIGDHKAVKSVLKNRSNPCSTDEYGLTPLMYAVWNGHVECVKWLLANDRGIDNSGFKRSCINMVSTKGYTALHLHCKDSLTWAYDIIYWLLAAGADVSLTSKTEGLTAEEYAEQGGNLRTLETIRNFRALSTYTGDPSDKHLDELIKILNIKRNELASKYAFHVDASVIVEPWGAKFAVPVFQRS